MSNQLAGKTTRLMTDLGVMSDSETFEQAVAEEISRFEETNLVRRVAAGSVKMEHYHTILTTVFHQTQSSPYTFAKAAAHCPWRLENIKDYLLQHAEEERTHWRWVLDDLKSTGYGGPDPRSVFPHASCEAYISFNERVAERMPPARLGIAAVLEGIGSRFGGVYGKKLLFSLGIEPAQASFFLSHGETDKVHAAELMEVIAKSPLTAEEWGWMVYAARMAGHFYRGMYDHEGYA